LKKAGDPDLADPIFESAGSIQVTLDHIEPLTKAFAMERSNSEHS